MSGPTNAIPGDDSFGTELPQTRVEDTQLDAETNMAKFSTTKEYQELKEYLASRIEYYQRYLPGNVPAENVPEEERAKYWAVACVLISEFNAVINAYEGVAQVVQDAR